MKKGQLTPTRLTGVETYDGETIECYVRKVLTEQQPIEHVSPSIYTAKSDGVIPDYDIRTDKWMIAQDAREKIAVSRELRSKEGPLEEPKEEVGKAEPIQATPNTESAEN
ncbi:hypothetical protein [Sigmofec virus UA08Rod_4822]|uniref:Uncharacterized protein n=1 Tax=Sigmofec virus UA08Rod_4822 TaxID=2929411 RepID=A0A976N111_9VIRU|nr:hypothetical protein [Sigmofec virus UA08Rod_4822]